MNESHLTVADLRRVTDGASDHLIPLLCHEEDCFVETSELDSGSGSPAAEPPPRATMDVSMNPFQQKLAYHQTPLTRGRFETLQINGPGSSIAPPPTGVPR